MPVSEPFRFQVKERTFEFHPETLMTWMILGGEERVRLSRDCIPSKNYDEALGHVLASSPKKSRGRYLTLNVAHACNLRCSYCFAGGGAYGGDTSLMNLETAKRAIDFIMTSPQVEIHFFGGEPMLNERVVVEAAGYAARKAAKSGTSLQFYLTTNGTHSLDRCLPFFKKHHFRIGVSLDGPKEHHDALRQFRNGSGTYDVVSANLRRWTEELGPEHIFAKMTTPQGAESLVPVVQSALELGVKEVLVTPVVPSSFCGAFSPEQQREYEEETVRLYWDFMEWYLPRMRKQPNIKIYPFHKHLTLLYRSKNLGYLCRAGTSFISIHPGGSIYPCYRLSSDESFLLGNVHEKAIDRTLIDRLIDTQGRVEDTCRSCWIRHMCGSNKCMFQNVLRGQPHASINDHVVCRYRKEAVKLFVYFLSFLDDKEKEETLSLAPIGHLYESPWQRLKQRLKVLAVTGRSGDDSVG